jgi:hypothetical protein
LSKKVEVSKPCPGEAEQRRIVWRSHFNDEDGTFNHAIIRQSNPSRADGFVGNMKRKMAKARS